MSSTSTTQVNSLETEQPPKTPETAAERKAPEGAEAKEASEEGKIETRRRTDGKLVADLEMGGGEAVVNPVSGETLIGEKESYLRESDQGTAAEAGSDIKNGKDSEAVDKIEDQLEEGKVQGTQTLVMSEAFRTIGNIYALEPGGTDEAKFGHKIGLEGKSVYAMKKADAPKMIEMLRNPPSGVGESLGSFDFKASSPLDLQTEGFEMQFKYKTPHGTEVKGEVTFLYAKTKEKEQAQVKEAAVPVKNEEGKNAESQLIGSEEAQVEEPVDIDEVGRELEEKRKQREALNKKQEAKKSSDTTQTPDTAFAPPVADEDDEQNPKNNVAQFARRKAAKETKKKAGQQEEKEDTAMAA